MKRFPHYLNRVLRPDADWLRNLPTNRAWGLVMVAIVGFATYGFTVGAWRAPEMGGYVAIKMPLLVMLTLGCNGLLNGLLGMLLHGTLSFRQSLMALLWANATAGVLLASIAPITLGLAWNAPAPDAANAVSAHAGYLLTHTILMAAVGIFSNLHLYRLLHGNGERGSLPTLFAWLAGNGLLGAQFSYILRPFFGSPNLKVAFIREDAFEGTFYESVWRSVLHITDGKEMESAVVLLLSLVALIIFHTRPEKNLPNK